LRMNHLISAAALILLEVVRAKDWSELTSTDYENIR